MKVGRLEDHVPIRQVTLGELANYGWEVTTPLQVARFLLAT